MPIFSMALFVDKTQTEGNRLTHIALIEFLEKARLSFLAQHKMTEDCIIPGVGFVIGELNVRYMAAAREGDKLMISLNVGDIAQRKCSLLYQLKTIPENKLIALAKTEIVFVDMLNEKSTVIPEAFLKILDKRQNESQPSIVSRL